MSKISIIGAGDVGASIAYTMQLSGLVTDIVLVDVDRERAAGHVMDMNHGLFFTPPVNITSGQYRDCSDSALIVITAGARQKQGETRLNLDERNAEIIRDICENLRAYVGSAKLLVVTNPVDVMTYVMLKVSGLDQSVVFGSGTVLDSARFRYQLSRHCRVDPRNVHAYVIGEHGDTEVFLWSQLNIGGMDMETFCDSCGRGCEVPTKQSTEREVRESAYHVIEAKGLTNYGVSLAVRKIASAVVRNELSLLTISTLLKGEYGLNEVCLSVPCVLGARGIDRVVTGPLASEEKQALSLSAGVIGSAISQLKI